MVKLVGAVLVLVSSCAIGALLALQVKEQEKWLKDIKTTLFLLLGELSYRQMPMPDAMELVGIRHSGRMKDFYLGMTEELQKKNGLSLQELWQKHALVSLKDSPLNGSQKEEFAELGLCFSETDKETRKNSLDFYLTRLEEDIVSLREKGADKAYLCRTLGMLGGIFLLILVL